MHRKIFCLLAALACLPAWAQDVPELNEIVVTATRVDTGVLESPSAITVITQQEIAASGAQDVAGVINGQPGVVVKDNGTQGSLKTVSIRGAVSEQVVVLLDGIRLNSNRDGMVDLSSIPMEIIDRIEIVRGSQSALYGSSAIGGVLNIITKKTQKPSLTFSIINGSYIPHDATAVTQTFPSFVTEPAAANYMDLVDSQKVELSLSGKIGDAGASAGGSFTRAENGFTWNDTTDIHGWRRRWNADLLSGAGFVGFDAPLLGGEISGKGIFDYSNVGAPGSLTQVSGARQTDTSASGSLSWKTNRFFADALTLDAKAFYRYDRLTYDDPSFPGDHRTQTANADLTQKLTFSDSLSAIYGGSASYDSVISTNYVSPKDRLNVAGFGSLPISLFERLTITPSLRYDYFSDYPGSFSYSLSAVFLLSDASSMRASFGSAYRVPTLNDLYWFDPSGFTAANPNLLPETSYNGEIGWSLDGKSISLDASVFTRLVVNNIIWLFDPLVGPFGTYLPENLTRTLFPGAEIRAKVLVTDQISLEASYTFIYSLLLNDGSTELSLADNARVPYAPMHSVAAKGRYSGKRHAFGGDVRYVSVQYTDRANTEATALPGYFAANADYRFTATENLVFTLAAKNIFSALYYTQAGYPMPPFSFETGVSLHL